ncbi:predicted protein [Phaeodactylum tricornutum CCAP 1055/1]|uniref:Uncharacterized protein n=2 Tax=Phaeodactylum tricornutum TaxID=2850 RepID=B7S3T9_PHATC|nr:predicted protein [Phaeodactylum tricornutum CCAP 1055/1]EEC42782.1 predicted protein [Phaeodactylum tricornutum CCAP 1055/1]|eukprot:XP_002176229.1 predicted protein [Phaeodactylum tricornutum CCAP 1055/1]
MDDISDTASDDQKDTEYVSNSRTIKFKGNEDEWRTWKGKTIATAMQHCFYQALFMQESLATMEEVNAGTASKSARKAFLRNVQAYAHLALCCEKTAYSYVENAVTERAPMGDAYEAWKKLCESINENVEEWFLELEYRNTRMGKIKQSYMRDDLQMKAHIIDQLPEAYEAVKVKLSGAYTTTPMETFKRIILDFWKRHNVLSPTETSSQWKFAEEEHLMQDNYNTKEEEAKMSEEPEPHKDKGFNEMTGNPDPGEDVLQEYHYVLISKNRNGLNAMEKPSIQDRKGLGGLIKRNSVPTRVGNRKSFKWKQAIFDIMVNLGIALGFIYWHAMKDLDKFRKLLGVHCMAVNNEIGQYIGVKTTEYEKEFIRDHKLEIWEEAKIFSIPGYHEEFHKGNEGQSVSKKQYSLLIGKIVFLVSKWITDCMTALRELSTLLDTVKWKMKSSNREDVKFGSQVGHVRQNATCHTKRFEKERALISS